MNSRNHRSLGDPEGLSRLDGELTQVLTAADERALMNEMAECRGKLSAALAALPGSPENSEESDAEALAHYVAKLRDSDGSDRARLGVVARRYDELRTKLALANMRLVAHVAKGFRDRGISQSDLLQEGFCGLLEAIDRFDLDRQTKLATYATWWIRQAMQRAVASGAYPVRLSPRHLRQLARSQDELGAEAAVGAPAGGSPEMIRRIHAATRPTVSLNATIDGEANFSLLQTISDTETDGGDDVDTGEAVGRLMVALKPREQQVMELRFGLSGGQKLSLSQVGKVMAVSKERVRQIQDRALEKLRAAAVGGNLAEALCVG